MSAQSQVTLAPDGATTGDTLTVEASADVLAEDLSPAYLGGQATGGRIGMLGTREP